MAHCTRMERWCCVHTENYSILHTFAVVVKGEIIMAKLKPCPFCGGEAIMFRPRNRTFIQCENYKIGVHDVLITAPTQEKAVKAWNTRTPKEGGAEI